MKQDKTVIVRPVGNTEVNSRTLTVRGHSHKHKAVQVYVLANDGMWYLQPPVKYTTAHRRRWHVEVWLGELSTKLQPNINYTIVAVETTERPETPLTELPDVPHSNAVKVSVRESAIG